VIDGTNKKTPPVEKRITREQSRKTKEEKLRTRTHRFYVRNAQGEENSRPLLK
jgi:hypothetical protein